MSGDGSDVDVDGSRHSWRDSWHGRLDSVLEEDDGKNYEI